MKDRLAGISLMILSLMIFAEVNHPGTIHKTVTEIQRIANSKK